MPKRYRKEKVPFSKFSNFKIWPADFAHVVAERAHHNTRVQGLGFRAVPKEPAGIAKGSTVFVYVDIKYLANQSALIAPYRKSAGAVAFGSKDGAAESTFVVRGGLIDSILEWKIEMGRFCGFRS